MERVKIDRRVPLPAERGNNAAKFPWSDLKVGDSFYSASAAARGGLYNIAKRHGIKITVRNEGDGVRVWRTA